jgi:DNA-binding XRE family transcriptional regulator
MKPRKQLAKEVGERIKEVRLSIGITQDAFGKPMGITREAVTQYETGVRMPRWEHAVMMCDAWGLSLDWIIRGRK